MNLKPPRPHGGRPGFGAIDRWLAERYQLTAPDRWKVEEAIFSDASKLGDSRLREAARGTAEELLSGRLKPPWLMRYVGWMIVGIGVAVTAVGVVMHVVGHSGGVFYLADGSLGILVGAFGVFWLPRQRRRNLIRLKDTG